MKRIRSTGPRITREIAQAAATDAGNRRMRALGRQRWDRDDFNEAVRVFDELMPPQTRRGDTEQ